MCAIRFGEFLKSSINGEHLSRRGRQSCLVFHTHTRGFSAVLVGGSSPGSGPVGCAAVNPFPQSFALQINKLNPLLHLICYQEPSLPSLLPPPQVSSPRPTTTPTRQPRPDNDVLITRLLGRKIALILIHMQENICHRLEAHPPHTHTTPTPPRHAVRVSGRLTLASCCEQS